MALLCIPLGYQLTNATLPRTIDIMKPPICKLCGKGHWTYEDHGTGSEEVRKVGASVLGYEKRTFPTEQPETVTKVSNNVTESVDSVTLEANNVTPVTKPVLSDGAEAATGHVKTQPVRQSYSGSSAPSPRAGRPKKHKTNAERQRAYRSRK